MSNTQAYWDGAQWTNHVAPAARSLPQPNPSEFTGLWHAGWVTAILFPLVGFIIGAVLCSKPGMTSKGVGVMIVALLFFLIWSAALI